ncbi:hypothetical protein A7J71_18140 [Achromobacter insolitus]|uniref:SGNH/GDSL hydrolase family protein n=1 Tax=Achromobacter insolitus TaxID=217204 RepID=UPI0007C7F3DF|nr:SGNH/GDSL hydrolase family protein [Achromobacter insolitus]OAE52888.1 hypothetical protein A7J71_18140 [Achromobacter insolitus]OCZ50626.1 hypothetical protein A7P22_15200 [Achromobacter insolitus]
MTTYKTGNPLGSKAAKDLYDNAENFDVAINGQESDRWEDRLGVERLTWSGIERQFAQFLESSGYQDMGDYRGGIELTSRNQIFRMEGEYYRLGPSRDLPYVTTGVWASESINFVSVGDAALRQQLAAPSTGSSIVGYRPASGPDSTVQDALRGLDASAASLNQEVDEAQGDIATLKVSAMADVLQNLDAHVVDMHFGTLRGVGWGATEIDMQVVTSTFAAAAGAGTISFSTTSAAAFKADQLICYRATNGEYYPAVIKAISGNTLTLKDATEAAVSAGGELHNFYINDAHPNEFGYYTIADDALRRLLYREQLFNVQRDYQAWTPYANGTVAADASFSYENPGIAEVANRSAKVTAGALGDGAQSPPVALPGGNYRFTIPVNIGARTGGFSGTVQVDVQEITSSGERYGISTQVIGGFNGIRLVEGLFTVRPGSTVRIIVTNAQAGGATFNVGRLSILRVLGRLASLNRGKHVLFGDSWFASGYILQRLQERLPKAAFVNRGVSGNKMVDLLARFATDVTPENPDFVWVMCGTNDTYGGYTAPQFETELNTLKSNLVRIGAQPIFFNCSVCSAFYPIAPGEQLTNSRRYALRVNYHNQVPQIDGPGSDVRSFAISGTVSVPAGSSVVIGSTPQLTSSAATLRNMFSIAGAAVTLRVGYATTITTTLTDQQSFAVGSTPADVLLTRTTTDRRIVNIVATNSTGSAVTVTVTAELSWAKD